VPRSIGFIETPAPNNPLLVKNGSESVPIGAAAAIGNWLSTPCGISPSAIFRSLRKRYGARYQRREGRHDAKDNAQRRAAVQ
jgi:hypothetical protein